MNYVRTAVLIAALTALFMAAGFLLGGQAGMLIALAIAAAMNLYAWWNSGASVLRYFKAREVDARTAPSLYNTVRQLADNAGLPMPRVYVAENDHPNAFATGRGPANAAVCATTGLLRLLDEREVAGVMAHEMAHVKHRDTLVMTITATLAGAISMLANFAMFFGSGDRRDNPPGIVGVLAVMILSPLAAMLVHMGISRGREYEADRGGAEICRHPLWLASELGKLHRGAQRINNMAAENNPATAHMFIVSPLHARATDSLFSTHPAVENRIARLKALAAAGPVRRGPWEG